MNKLNIGVIGLATMGSNLARNLARNGYSVGVYNRSYEKTVILEKTFINDKIQNPKSGELIGFQELANFINSLERPRKIILLVKSGTAVDNMIEQIYPLLDDQDILIDTGNSNWEDTLKRQNQIEGGKFFTIENILKQTELTHNKKIHFIGCGVSGGEEGALNGPSLMPGGDRETVENILPFFQKIAAADFTGKPCVTYIGQGPAGHFVKMVHNGIEYAMMQGIAEIYDILRHLGLDAMHISKVFEKLNTGSTESFLTKISIDILKQNDSLESGFLVDKISSVAGSKGTGKWTVEAGMNLGIAVPNIAAALFARVLSSRTHNFPTKIRVNEIISLENQNQDKLLQSLDLEIFHNTLKAIYYTSYLQGLDLILAADKEYHWSIDLAEVLRIWQGGCIIRSKMLEDFSNSFSGGEFKDLTIELEICHTDLITMFNFLAKQSFCLPLLSVFNSSLDYAGSLTMDNLPLNLTQAQRDYFGAHSYARIDKKGVFTGGWEE